MNYHMGTHQHSHTQQEDAGAMESEVEVLALLVWVGWWDTQQMQEESLTMDQQLA